MTEKQKLQHVHDALKKKFKDKKLIFGKGPIGAKIVFVGDFVDLEAAEESKPLNARSEKLLNQLLRIAGVNKKHIYVTNVVKYIPPRDRALTSKEIKSHATFLREEVKTINPDIVVTLGSIALTGIGLRQPLDNVHGRIFHLGDYSLLPTFNPELALKDARVKTLVESDFVKLKELVSLKKEAKTA